MTQKPQIKFTFEAWHDEVRFAWFKWQMKHKIRKTRAKVFAFIDLIKAAKSR